MKRKIIIFLAICVIFILPLGASEFLDTGLEQPPYKATLTKEICPMKPTWPLMIGFQGTTPEDDGVQQALSFLEKDLIAGVIFFAHNITSPDQVKKLTQAFLKVESPHPPLLAIDQEGGLVQRLSDKNGFQSFPKAHEIATTCTPDEALTLYQDMAKQTRAAGFNYVFGPVVDFHEPTCPVIGKIGRAYGEDANTIEAYAKAFIDAHQQEGVLTCLKHFPGHGLTTSDTHQGWVDVTETFQEKELAPFQNLINAGYGESLMAAHIFHQNWDDQHPVSLSEHFMPSCLRQNMGYDGVVVTDDLHMGAIGKHFDLETILRQAMMAQNDLLIFSGNPLASGDAVNFDPHTTLPERLPDFISDFLNKGFITSSLIEHAWRRIDKMRKSLAL